LILAAVRPPFLAAVRPPFLAAVRPAFLAGAARDQRSHLATRI
jgi:hypothetical protein